MEAGVVKNGPGGSMLAGTLRYPASSSAKVRAEKSEKE